MQRQNLFLFVQKLGVLQEGQKLEDQANFEYIFKNGKSYGHGMAEYCLMRILQQKSSMCKTIYKYIQYFCYL